MRWIVIDLSKPLNLLADETRKIIDEIQKELQRLLNDNKKEEKCQK